MSLAQFYLEQQVLEDEEGETIPLRLSSEDLHHFKVLRMRKGEHLAVIDAAGVYYECELTDATWDAPCVRICLRDDSSEKGPNVVLFQGVAKGDKLDTIVRQATEVGVTGVVFVPFRRCVQTFEGKQADARRARWGAIAKSAAMQSGRRVIPEVTLLSSAAEADDVLASATCVLVFWEEASATSRLETAISSALSAQSCSANDARVAVVIGPEGGLEPEEVEHLCSLNPYTYVVTLGPTILRTETAGVVAPALVLNALRA